MKLSNNQIADIIHQYVVEGISMKNIGDSYSKSESEISSILEKYHIGGAENKTGKGNFGGGKFRKLYQDGIDFINKNGEDDHTELSHEILLGYVNANRNKKGYTQTIKEYLEGDDDKSPVFGLLKLPLLVIGGILVIIVAMSVLSLLGGKEKTTGIVGSSGKKPFSGPFAFLSSYFSGDYEIEGYELNEWVYLGNKKYNDPAGINFRYTSHTNAQYDLGDFNDDRINGNSVSYNYDKYFFIGKRNKSKYTDSWCICNDSITNEIYLAYYKKGQPTGIGILNNGKQTSIVDFDKNKETIATYSAGEWTKPNGKKLKLKKGNKYKKLVINSQYDYEVDKITISIDPSNYKYLSDKFSFEGTKNHFKAFYEVKKGRIDFEYNDGNRVYMLYTKNDGSDQGVDVELTRHIIDTDDTKEEDDSFFDPLGIQDGIDSAKDYLDSDSKGGNGYTVNDDGTLTLDSGVVVTVEK